MSALKKPQVNNFEDVMKFLVPQYKFLAQLLFKRNKEELISLSNRIKEGLNSNSTIIFDPKNEKLNINIKMLEKEKGKEWVLLLKKQLHSLLELLS